MTLIWHKYGVYAVYKPTAFRCLIAHRETVAREKGRKTLADEVATINAINAKIDAQRAREERAAEIAAKRERGVNGG